MNRDMDTSERDKFGVDNRSDDHLSYQRSDLSATQWKFGNQILGFISPNSSITLCQGTHMGSSPSPSVSITDSFCSTFMMPSRLDTGGVFLKTDNGALPPSLSNFPTDSAFIERAARFSCFNGDNFRGVANREIGINRNHGFDSGSPVEDQRDTGSLHGVRVLSNESGETEFNGGVQEESANLGSAKKRKRTNQDMELDQVEGAERLSVETSKENKDTKQKGEEKSSTMETMKPSLKQAKDSSNSPKEDYIHVRARRGQATNSHSLAERVRREKISERMKFLQDLVPGCSKVTGKAVMLDEIINYVQSLQRQVECLSMKLSSVNERSDFNMEGLLSKDFIQSRIDSSLTMGFSHDMIHPQLRPPQSSLVQGGLNTVTHLSDALRRSINAPLRIINGYKEPTPQIPASWDGELHNVLQMNFGASNPVIGATQDVAHSRSG